MKMIAVALASLLLAGCQSMGADGYRFAGSLPSGASSNVRVITHPSMKDLRADPAARREAGDKQLMAWSKVRPGECEIHIVDPAKEWWPQWLGHELAHCLAGRWHP